VGEQRRVRGVPGQQEHGAGEIVAGALSLQTISTALVIRATRARMRGTIDAALTRFSRSGRTEYFKPFAQSSPRWTIATWTPTLVGRDEGQPANLQEFGGREEHHVQRKMQDGVDNDAAVASDCGKMIEGMQ
jgi:hypothetical protein